MKALRISLSSALLWPASALALDTIESYDASLGENPEGVAVTSDGDVYVTLAGTGELRRIDAKTHLGETVATFDVGDGFLLGMALDDGDGLYVALASFDADTSGIWAVDEDGGTERVVAFSGSSFPNDLTFDEDGNLFITESISGAVYRVSADDLADATSAVVPSVWVQDTVLEGDVEVSPVPFPIGANGITYDDEADVVIVANSQVPAILEIADDGGEAGDISVLASGEHLRGADGVALGKSGDVYVVANFTSSVLRIDRDDGSAAVLADGDDGLVFPSTLAFGQRNNKKSVYIANFGFGAGDDAPVGVLQLSVGEKGEANPAGT